MKYWIKNNPEFVIIMVVALMVGSWILFASGKSEVTESIKSDSEVIDERVDYIDLTEEELKIKVDSVRGAVLKENVSFTNQRKQDEKRNTKTVPRTAKKVVDSDVDDQLLWWNDKRANANR